MNLPLHDVIDDANVPGLRDAIAPAELFSAPLYERLRPAYRAEMIALKRRRRLALGSCVTVLFENRDTVLYQLHEALRAEGIADPARRAARIGDYDRLVPRPGELTLTLLVDGACPARSARIAEALAASTACLSLSIGHRPIPAEPLDLDQFPDGAVRYLRFVLSPADARRLGRCRPAVHLELQCAGYAAAVRLGRPLRTELVADARSRSEGWSASAGDQALGCVRCRGCIHRHDQGTESRQASTVPSVGSGWSSRAPRQ